MLSVIIASILAVAMAEPLPAGITAAPRAFIEPEAEPTTTITTCTPSGIQYPTVASGYNLHHVCGTQCTAEYPLCNCVQLALYSWYCGPDPYDSSTATYYGCCQDWGNGTYGCFCDGTPGAP